MLELILQAFFVLCIVPFVLAALWLLGVPYTRRTEDTPAASNLDGVPLVMEVGRASEVSSKPEQRDADD